jgi:hypothetical protein
LKMRSSCASFVTVVTAIYPLEYLFNHGPFIAFAAQTQT